MSWNNKIGIRGISLIFFICFLFIYYLILNDKGDWNWSELFLVLAEAAMSIWITLTIIEYAIKADRKHQWQKINLFIYRSIIFDLIRLASDANEMGKNLGMESMNDIQFLYSTGHQLEISANMIEVGSYIKNINKNKQNININFKHFHDGTVLSLRHTSVLLIPRILELSDDEELNLALLRFDDRYRRLSLIKNYPIDEITLCNLDLNHSDTKILMENIELVINRLTYWNFLENFSYLLIEGGLLYELLLSKIKNTDETSLIDRLKHIICNWWDPWAQSGNLAK